MSQKLIMLGVKALIQKRIDYWARCEAEYNTAADDKRSGEGERAVADAAGRIYRLCATDLKHLLDEIPDL